MKQQEIEIFRIGVGFFPRARTRSPECPELVITAEGAGVRAWIDVDGYDNNASFHLNRQEVAGLHLALGKWLKENETA